eukprot:symbB.v1.2.015373.t1/scaffold1146.1/size135487/5
MKNPHLLQWHLSLLWAEVSQPVRQEDGDEVDNEDATLRTFNGELRIDSLFVGLVIEGPSRSLATSSVWGTAAALASSEPRQRREASKGVLLVLSKMSLQTAVVNCSGHF